MIEKYMVHKNDMRKSDMKVWDKKMISISKVSYEVVKLLDYNEDIRKLTLKIIHLENDIKKREEDFKETIDKKYVLKSHLKLAFISRKELKEEIEKFEDLFIWERKDSLIHRNDWNTLKNNLGIEQNEQNDGDIIDVRMEG